MQLSILALGSLRVELNSRPVTNFRFERVRMLLVYLLVEKERVHDRVTIACLLWPEEPQKTALENLRQAIAMLRRAVQDCPKTSSFIKTTSKTIQINGQNEYRFDYDRFTSLIKRVHCHERCHSTTCFDCIETLQEAISLYRGDFLADVVIESDLFEAWAQAIRNQLYFKTTWAMRQILAYYAKRENYIQVLELAQRLLTIDPFCETGQHMMIVALALQGCRHSAIAQYNAYKKMLSDELGILPPGETMQFYQEILLTDGPIERLVRCVPLSLPERVYPFAPINGMMNTVLRL